MIQTLPARTQRKTRGRREFLIQRGDRFYYPPCSYTHWAEGDTTFASKRRNVGKRTPRHVKKYLRKDLHMGPYRPYWTRHATRSATVLVPGVLR